MTFFHYSAHFYNLFLRLNRIKRPRDARDKRDEETKHNKFFVTFVSFVPCVSWAHKDNRLKIGNEKDNFVATCVLLMTKAPSYTLAPADSTKVEAALSDPPDE
jgi:hypothetical protein